MMAQIPIHTPDPAEDLQQVIAAENARLAEEGIGTQFSVKLLPRPGEGCRERFVVSHSYTNSVEISKTEVVIMFSGEIRAFHTKFTWDSLEEVSGGEFGRREQRHTLRKLLEWILNADTQYSASRRERPRSRRI